MELDTHQRAFVKIKDKDGYRKVIILSVVVRYVSLSMICHVVSTDCLGIPVGLTTVI